MAEFDLEDPRGGSAADPPEPPDIAAPADTSIASAVQAYALELNHYYGRIKLWRDMDPQDVLIELSGYSARLTEMRANCQRYASKPRGGLANGFRTKEIDPLLTEFDRQFKIHSRLQAIREFDLKILGGAPS